MVVAGNNAADAADADFVVVVAGLCVFGGQVWALVGITNLDVLVSPAAHKDPKMPS